MMPPIHQTKPKVMQFQEVQHNKDFHGFTSVLLSDGQMWHKSWREGSVWVKFDLPPVCDP